MDLPQRSILGHPGLERRNSCHFSLRTVCNVSAMCACGVWYVVCVCGVCKVGVGVTFRHKTVYVTNHTVTCKISQPTYRLVIVGLLADWSCEDHACFF